MLAYLVPVLRKLLIKLRVVRKWSNLNEEVVKADFKCNLIKSKNDRAHEARNSV